MKGKYLSVLGKADEGCVTYYVGDKLEHVKHLKKCTLICHHGFSPELEDVELIHVEDAQLEFYKLSHTIQNQYTFTKNLFGNYQYTKGNNCEIDPTSVIGDGVTIGNNVIIGPNVTIYSKTRIGDNVIIGSNSTIGAEGMMWAWEGNKKVFLKQLGGVKILDNCIIGSNSVIVRGSANEFTIIEEDVNMAPGCLIGHGTFIGQSTHLANGVKTGGSAKIASYNFLGSGSVISPGVNISASDVIIGAGSTVVKNIEIEGVYVGSPTKRIKTTSGKLSGIPNWKKIN